MSSQSEQTDLIRENLFGGRNLQRKGESALQEKSFTYIKRSQSVIGLTIPV